MKYTILSILLAILPIEAIFAQDVIQKEVYVYRSAAKLDNKTNEVVDPMNNISGIIVYSSAGGNDYFSLTVGDTLMYNGIISRVKEGTRENDFSSIIYLVFQEVEGYLVPLQVFKIYDYSYSRVIPKEFIVQTLQKDTYEVVQNLEFGTISRTN